MTNGGGNLRAAVGVGCAPLRSFAWHPGRCILNQAYQVPKQSLLAEITLVGHSPQTLRLFLSEQTATRAGGERPSDLLNGPCSFLPVSDSEDHVVFVNRQAVLSLSVDAESEFGGQHAGAEDLAPEQAISTKVQILMDNGASLTGSLRYLMPEGSRRLQDLLNLPLQFLTLRDGERAHLINKSHILRIAQI